jgi:hypothetical protein
MRIGSPRARGIMLLLAGLILALFLAIVQSSHETALPEFAIALVAITACVCVAFGAFMALKNRGARTDTGIR